MRNHSAISIPNPIEYTVLYLETEEVYILECSWCIATINQAHSHMLWKITPIGITDTKQKHTYPSRCHSGTCFKVPTLACSFFHAALVSNCTMFGRVYSLFGVVHFRRCKPKNISWMIPQKFYGDAVIRHTSQICRH